jgi:hypothetical protein
VFSTTNELEFESGGLNPPREKPTREELLSYYVRFVLDHELNVQTEEKVISVSSVHQSLLHLRLRLLLFFCVFRGSVS